MFKRKRRRSLKPFLSIFIFTYSMHVYFHIQMLTYYPKYSVIHEYPCIKGCMVFVCLCNLIRLDIKKEQVKTHANLLKV